MADFKIVTGGMPTQTQILMNGEPVEGVFKFELEQDTEGFPTLILHIHPSSLTADLERTADNVRLYIIADERESLAREVPLLPANDDNPKYLGNVSG